MSLATWKAEFYPTRAIDTDPKDAVAHSLQKWIGLRQGNLDRHELTLGPDRYYARDRNDDRLWIDDSTCALCKSYLHTKCIACPLALVNGGNRCDIGADSPYQQWGAAGDPEPMIAALQRAAALPPAKDRS